MQSVAKVLNREFLPASQQISWIDLSTLSSTRDLFISARFHHKTVPNITAQQFQSLLRYKKQMMFSYMAKPSLVSRLTLNNLLKDLHSTLE